MRFLFNIFYYKFVFQQQDQNIIYLSYDEINVSHVVMPPSPSTTHSGDFVADPLNIQQYYQTFEDTTFTQDQQKEPERIVDVSKI